MNTKQKIVFILVWLIAFIALILSLVLNKQIKELQDEHKECIHWVRKITIYKPADKIKLDKFMTLHACSNRSYEEALFNSYHDVYEGNTNKDS